MQFSRSSGKPLAFRKCFQQGCPSIDMMKVSRQVHATALRSTPWEQGWTSQEEEIPYLWRSQGRTSCPKNRELVDSRYNNPLAQTKARNVARKTSDSWTNELTTNRWRTLMQSIARAARSMVKRCATRTKLAFRARHFVDRSGKNERC